MYSLVYNSYFYLKRKQKANIKKQKKNFFVQKLIDRIEWFYNIPVVNWYKKHPSRIVGVNEQQRKNKIIVSLTSYPKRIGTIWITIETLLRQTVKPDAIILWLAESQFEGLDSLPKELLNLQKRGLSIRFCDDLRSHKKYYYAMQEYPDAVVILVDDDMFYPYDTIEKLLKLHKNHPDDICTMTAQVIVQGKNPSEWSNPSLKECFEHSSDIQIFSGSGSLYPPHSISQKAFDKTMIKELCPYADDLWLTYMAFKKGTKITMQYPWRAFPITIYGTGEGSLYYINAESGQNDLQWEKLKKLDGE